ncbi:MULTISPECIES: polyribonucleotide nucleotidyltransferase [unclassified Lysinibacillus]|uniref:polyribonucleotide nucleotidyltransferase n=1 Tax=unclassified Lysinibacillus TaxID=2636778 RepID=UPI002011A3C5|nr:MULTISPECIES: polyribonucleotide nucleotidyltransferase [unclassified Lysinibacillus]MCL1697967.1 polyribonucleotide nucleotidyltransferase [Lysinibacillus sp. BPa_S21]MCL1702939.1 polyribonucleotide nucleotidyltransferase [Lysinibacillus sp. Bpr_S20]
MFLYDNMVNEECMMEINTIMSSQIMELQQTVKMSVLQNALTLNTVAAADLLKALPQQQVTIYPYKGSVIDISI